MRLGHISKATIESAFECGEPLTRESAHGMNRIVASKESSDVGGRVKSRVGFGLRAGSARHAERRSRKQIQARTDDRGAQGAPVAEPQFPVVISKRPHPIPSRTRKLSSSEPMVLHGQPCGRVGRRRDFSRKKLERPRIARLSSFLLLSRSSPTMSGDAVLPTTLSG